MGNQNLWDHFVNMQLKRSLKKNISGGSFRGGAMLVINTEQKKPQGCK